MALSVASQNILNQVLNYKNTIHPVNSSSTKPLTIKKPVTLSNIPKGVNPSLDALREKLFGKNKNTSISAGILKAQQELSEKYGIGTFNYQGQVNTIPTTRPYDTRINIGTGSTGLTSQTLNEFLAKLSPVQALVPTQTIVTGSGFTYESPKASKLVEGEIALPERNIASSISTTFQQYSPYIILGGLALLAITLLKR